MGSLKFNHNTLAMKLKEQIPEISFAIVFGSSSGGKIEPDSDLDVAVFFEDIRIINADMISGIIGTVEDTVKNAVCDLTILNTAGPVAAFEALRGTVLFIREDAVDLYADFYSLTCRKYEEAVWWMNQQLRYRGYEI